VSYLDDQVAYEVLDTCPSCGAELSRRHDCARHAAWVADLENQANRPQVPRGADTTTIDGLNTLADEQIRFRHLRDLKVGGRDEFSRLDVLALVDRVDRAEVERVQRSLTPPQWAPALRWLLRGLRLDLAIRKVRVDAEVGRLAAGGPRYDDTVIVPPGSELHVALEIAFAILAAPGDPHDDRAEPHLTTE
jgi:hypothetical protein